MTSTKQPENNKKGDEKKRPLLSRKDFLIIAGSTGAAAAVTQVITSGPLSPDAIQGIDRSHSEGESQYDWCMGIDLST